MSRIKLKQIAIEKNERIDNPSQSSYTRFVGLEHYDSGEATIRRYGSTERLESTMKVFRAGDILVARRNVYLKRAATVDFDGLTSGDSIVLHIENEVYRRIIPFVLNTDEFWDYANQHADGSMSKRLSPKLLMEYEFSLPDDNLEQISSILWAMERVKTAYRELIAKTDELVKSQFIEMFKGGQYPIVKAAEVCDFITKGTTPPSSEIFTEPRDDSIPYLKVYNLSFDGSLLFFNEPQYISRETHEGKLARSKVFPNDVLMNIVGPPLGKFSLVTNDFPEWNINQAIAIFRAKVQILPKFLLHALMQPDVLTPFLDKAQGVRQLNFSLEQCRNLTFPLPDIKEQEAFCRFVEQSDKSKFEAQQAMENLRVAQKALMRQHLTK